MTDPTLSSDFVIETGFIVKSEPMALEPMICTTHSSASMPIPVRRALDMPDRRDFGLELVDNSCSNSLQGIGSATSQSLYSSNSLWSTRLTDGTEVKSEIKMEDDDIFQVDKADLIQGPTLAELNANDETLLEDLNFDDLLLPEESACFINVPQLSRLSPALANSGFNTCASSFPPDGIGFFKESFATSSSVPSSPMDATTAKNHQTTVSPASQNSSSSSLLVRSATSSVTPPPLGVSPLQQRHSTLHELLMKNSVSPERQVLGQSVPGPSSSLTSTSPAFTKSRYSPASRLSSSAPTHLGLDQIWQRREPRPHLLSTSSLAEGGSTSSLSTGGVLSPEAHDFSLDEGFDSEDDSDHYEDFSSDAESGSDGEGGSSVRTSKKERYFWQYNVQAKGPKGQRLVLKTQLEDPHCLNQVTDPVFSPQCSVQGIKHSGKARKGDGNDLTPNPRKLHAIGKELDKLSKIINEMTPVSELPFNVRPKTRKEKNKLASRACRLKKKAQHEANKIKLCGLEHEHKRLLTGINQMKQLYITKFSSDGQISDDVTDFGKQSDKIVKAATKLKVAGQTTEFVNKILDKVKTGVPNGGLDDI